MCQHCEHCCVVSVDKQAQNRWSGESRLALHALKLIMSQTASFSLLMYACSYDCTQHACWLMFMIIYIVVLSHPVVEDSSKDNQT